MYISKKVHALKPIKSINILNYTSIQLYYNDFFILATFPSPFCHYAASKPFMKLIPVQDGH